MGQFYCCRYKYLQSTFRLGTLHSFEHAYSVLGCTGFLRLPHWTQWVLFGHRPINTASLHFEGGCLSERCRDDAFCISIDLPNRDSTSERLGQGLCSWRIDHIPWKSKRLSLRFLFHAQLRGALNPFSGSIFTKAVNEQLWIRLEFLSEARNPEFGMCKRSLNETLCRNFLLI